MCGAPYANSQEDNIKKFNSGQIFLKKKSYISRFEMRTN